MNEIIFINGPPESGKDALGDYLNKKESFIRYKFASPLVSMAQVLSDYAKTGEFDTSREWKNSNVIGTNKTNRELMIALSENAIKPLLGKDYLGISAARSIHEELSFLNQLPIATNGFSYVVTDAGFLEEVEACIDCLPDFKATIWRLHRDGCTFEGDSRSYVTIDNPKVKNFDIYNNGSLQDLFSTADKILKRWRSLDVF